MGIISKIANVNKYERGANYELGNSLSGTAVSTLFGTGGAEINVLEEYSGIAWKCIDIKAERLADQDLFVQRLVDNKWQEDKQHPFNLVLEGGDGQLDQSELLEAWSKSMDLYGEAFFYFSKGERSAQPFAVYPLNPASMTVLIANKKVTGYIWQEDGERVLMDVSEVKHWKYHDWRHPFRGTGPMQSAGWFIKSSRYTITYLNNFMENNGIPAGVIVAKDGFPNDDDWNLFKEQWAAKYSGINNAGKTGFVRGANLEFVKTGLSLGEVDFEKVKKSNREDIMFMFGISKPMAAIFDDINRASAVTAERLFAKSLTSPSLRRLQRKLSKSVAIWYGPQYQIGATNPVPEDDEIRITRLEKGVNKWLTVNEARIADGLEPLGSEFDVIQSQTPTPAAAPKSIGKIRIKTIKKNNKAEFSYEMKESFRGEMQDIQEKYEQQFLQKSNKVLKAQKEMVLDQLQPKKVVTAHFDPEEESKKLAEEVLPLFILLAQEQGQLAASFVGGPDTQFSLTEVTQKYIAASVAKATLGFSQETQEKIAKALADGLTEGESIARIAKRINALYDEVLGVKTPGYRIERLARTEVIKTSNEITETAYKQTGLVKKKEWFANPGKCEFCAALNGSVIQLGASFVPKDGKLEGVDGGTRVNTYEAVNHPPVHAQCRCALLPVIEEVE